MSSKISVTDMFAELVRLGHLTPQTELGSMTPPGSLRQVPSVTTYGTADVPLGVGVHTHAELEQHSQGNSARPSNAK
jgi:hypothetical protein